MWYNQTMKLSMSEKIAKWIFWKIQGKIPDDDLIENALDNYADEISESLQDMYEYPDVY